MEMRLSSKLTGGFGAVAAIVVLVGLLAVWGASRLLSDVRSIGNIHMPGVELAQSIEVDMRTVDSAENSLMQTTLTRAEIAAILKEFADSRAQADTAIAHFQALPMAADEVQTWQDFKNAFASWWDQHQKIVAVAAAYEMNPTAANYEALTIQMKTNDAAFGAASKLLDKLQRLEDAAAQAAVANSKSMSAQVKWYSIAGIIIGISLAFVIAFIIIRSTMKQVGTEPATMEALTGRIADGDLGVKLGAEGYRQLSMFRLEASS